eukprot:g39349.t1
MIDVRSGPMKYNVWVGEAVLNKHVGHMKAANSQTGHEENIPGPSEHPARLLEPNCSPPSSSIKEDKADLALTPLPPGEEDEFHPRHSGHKRRATVWHTLPVSGAEWEELDL